MERIEHETLEAADSRKQSHLELAFKSQSKQIDDRFYYEPMLAGHANEFDQMPFTLGEKQMKFPIWISSMTGGTSAAGPINKILAKTAAKHGFGMGLGSCRIILEDDTYLEDFNLRPILGEELPFYANVGIAQIERLLHEGQASKLTKLVQKLNADGLIVHINPLQEWLQPEGDLIMDSPLVTLEKLFNEVDLPIIVKEVGQGFGPESMKALLQMPLLAIDFAANGGTNFSKLELIRNEKLQDFFGEVVNLGHSAEEMIGFLNTAKAELGDQAKCNKIIVSGGIKNFLDGYYHISKSTLDAAYGQAAPFLHYANESQEALDQFASFQIQGLLMSKQLLKVK